MVFIRIFDEKKKLIWACAFFTSPMVAYWDLYVYLKTIRLNFGELTGKIQDTWWSGINFKWYVLIIQFFSSDEKFWKVKLLDIEDAFSVLCSKSQKSKYIHQENTYQKFIRWEILYFAENQLFVIISASGDSKNLA